MYQSAFNAVKLVNFDIQFMAVDCLFPEVTFFHIMILKMLVPVGLVVMLMCVVCLVLLARCCFGWVAKKLRRKTSAELIDAAISSLISLIMTQYLTLVSGIGAYVACTQLDDGTYVLDASPNIYCYDSDGEHFRWQWLFIFGVITFVFGIPACVSYIALIKRNRLLNDCKTLPEYYTRRYSCISGDYRDGLHGYACTVCHVIVGGHWWCWYVVLSSAWYTQCFHDH